ncbi:acyl-CoA carboxylase epsilon subunit [Streptomyces sp. NBC_01320]|uniref:acyl-CoA carboxylase epsilon subunit n=1 Tax=Streptomyces sp. NBC_01320 TaxID=2903824 RepID=UPI002E0DEF45|nr:acyl-CoA carboxylase subunit epsilon [Streptomyces sp. NBC_01320]
MTPIRVLHGQPTPEELAAVMALLAARAAASHQAQATSRTCAWASRGEPMHRIPRPGPTAWRTSAWPR